MLIFSNHFWTKNYSRLMPLANNWSSLICKCLPFVTFVHFTLSLNPIKILGKFCFSFFTSHESESASEITCYYYSESVSAFRFGINKYLTVGALTGVYHLLPNVRNIWVLLSHYLHVHINPWGGLEIRNHTSLRFRSFPLPLLLNFY